MENSPPLLRVGCPTSIPSLFFVLPLGPWSRQEKTRVIRSREGKGAEKKGGSEGERTGGDFGIKDIEEKLGN